MYSVVVSTGIIFVVVGGCRNEEVVLTGIIPVVVLSERTLFVVGVGTLTPFVVVVRQVSEVL